MSFEDEHGLMDKKKRWGNSAMKGHGVNSPAMMEARKKIASKMKSKATKCYTEHTNGKYGGCSIPHIHE